MTTVHYQNITSVGIDVYDKEPKEAIAHINDQVKRHKSFLYLSGTPTNPLELTEEMLVGASSIVLHHNILGG